MPPSRVFLLSFLIMFACMNYVKSFKLWKARTCLGNDHNQWHPAEAALFCIRAISNYVSTVEAEVMPKVKHF